MSVTAGVFDKQVSIRASISAGSSGVVNQSIVPAPSLTTTGIPVVAASQTINYGDFTILSSGNITQAIALPSSNSTFTASGGSTNVYGVAQDGIATNSSGIDNTGPFPKYSIPVALWDANLEILLRIYNATAANTTQATLTNGTAYQYGRWRGTAATIWWYALSTTTTNGELRFVEAYGQGDALPTDQYGLVWLRPVQSLIALS